MPLPESGVRLVIEGLTVAQRGIDELASGLDDLQGQSYEVEVNTTVDNSGLDDLPLDGETVDFTVNEKIDVAPADENSTEILGVLQSINAKETFRMILDIAGTALDFLKAFESFAIEPMLDLEDVVARINAQTNKTVPNARELVSGIFYDDLGDSIDQVGRLVIKAAQIKAPIDEAVRSALTFVHTFQDENPEQVLDTLNQMVIGKLAPNFTEAGDLLVRAFQTSANRGGDLLQVIGDNAIAIHDLGLTGPEALSFIKTGMDAGFKSAQQVVDVLLKIKQNVTNAAGNSTSDVSKTLRILGIANPADTGEAWSAEFFTSVIDAIKNEPGLSDTDREALFTNLVGGKQGGKTFSAFLEISPAEAKTIFANLPGAAAEAAAESDNSLRGSVDDFILVVNKKLQGFLSSTAVDLPGKIALLKTGLQDGLDKLAAGGTLGEALTVALKPIGFDDEFQGLEKMLGDFVIGILQAVASIQEVTGHGAEAAGTRLTIEGLAKSQLAFDLSIANPDEVAASVASATSRGLAASEVTTQVSNIIRELVATGTKDSLAQAQSILDEFEKNAPNLQVANDLNGEQISQAAAALADGGDRLKSALETGIVIDVSPNLTPENAAVLQEKINEALRTAPPPDVIDELSKNMGLLDTGIKGVSTVATESTNPLFKITDATRDVGKAAKAVYGPVQDSAGALDMVTGAAPPATTALFGVGGALDAITNKATAFNTAAGAATDAANAAVTTAANTSGGGNSAPSQTQSSESLMSALMPFVPGGTVSSGGGSSFNLSSINLVPNIATADALGYRQAAILRGAAQK